MLAGSDGISGEVRSEVEAAIEAKKARGDEVNDEEEEDDAADGGGAGVHPGPPVNISPPAMSSTHPSIMRSQMRQSVPSPPPRPQEHRRNDPCGAPPLKRPRMEGHAGGGGPAAQTAASSADSVITIAAADLDQPGEPMAGGSCKDVHQNCQQQQAPPEAGKMLMATAETAKMSEHPAGTQSLPHSLHSNDGITKRFDNIAEMVRAQEAKLKRETEEAMAAKDQQLASKDQELESLILEVITLKQQLASKDRELAALRLQVRGVEVYDVDAGGSRVEERADAEPPAERVRREQDARMRVCEMYQARLVEVKKEHEEEGERRESAMRSAVEAKVKEKLAEVAQAFECACCFETLGEGSVAFSPCGHTYCNRPRCASAQAVECPECRTPVEGRVELFGSLGDVRSALAAGGAVAD